MPGRRTSIYLSERMENLLAAHGPQPEGSQRNIGEKIDYIVRAYDAILRDEKKRMSLTPGEWSVLLECCWGHAFAMEVGGPMDVDVDACLVCVEDTLDSELTTDGGAAARVSLISKLQAATVAQSIALAWMVIRERKRIG